MTPLRAIALLLVGLVLAGPSVAAARGLDDLMMELNIAPFDPQAPPPFSITTVEGARVSLLDVKGKAVLVYFWATW